MRRETLSVLLNESCERGAHQNLAQLLSDRVRANSLIGREQETARLVAGLDDAIAGRGRLSLISGEPGIGKTRLAEEIARAAAERGMRVIWGRCWEGRGAPAYWPWVQILRSLIVHPGDTRFRPPVVTQEMSRLIPELSMESGRPSKADPDEARFRLFDGVATMLKESARSKPLFLVLDDLHDADHASLEMLKFVAPGLSIACISVVGTFREGTINRSATVGSIIGELMREGHQLPLRGLNEAEVASFLEDHVGLAANEKLVTALHQATAGNPLFLDGVVRMLLAEGKLAHPETISASDLTVPDGARNAIRSQVNYLSQEAQSILAVASTAGNEFEVGLLQSVAGVREKEVLDLLDEAVAAKITTPILGSRTRYRFAHGLIRTAIYDALGSAERTLLHRQIGEKLEDLHSSDLDSHLAELAHHFVEAIPSFSADKAVDYSIRAGQAAYEILAFEDAASHWRTALALMQDPVAERRAWLLERLGNPHLHGLEKSGIEYLKEALRIYERLGNTESAARAQVNLGHMLRGASDLSQRDLRLALSYFRKAESELPATQKPRLLASLYVGLSDVSWELAHADEGFEASARAMEICERLGDELHWVGAATAHAYSLNSRGRQAEGFSLLGQAWQKADRLNNVAAASFAASQICYHHSLLWNPAEGEGWARRELSRTRVAQAPALRKEIIHCLAHAYLCTGKPLETKQLAAQAGCLFVEGVVAFYYGDWEEAERVFYRDIEVQGQRTGRPVQEFFAMLGLARLHRASDRIIQAEVLLKRALAIVEGQILHLEIDVRSELALLYGETARPKEAQPHLARMREIIAPGENWAGLAGHVMRAEAAVAAMEERFEEARAYFESAVDIARRHQVPWDEAEAFFCWGRGYMSMGQHQAALEKFDSAIDIYRRIGAGARWIDRASSMRFMAEERATLIKPPVDGIFHLDGDFWTIGIGNAAGKIKDLRGMHYIFHLLQHPGERIHVRELAQVEAEIERATRSESGRFVDDPYKESGSTARGLGDAGPALDSRAISAYKCRLDEVRSELQEAESFNDTGRVARLREERESLGHQLRSALTRHGRIRIAGAHGERARSAVCKSIRFSMKRIAKLDPTLGRFLNETVHTGYECAYLPKNPFTWMF